MTDLVQQTAGGLASTATLDDEPTRIRSFDFSRQDTVERARLRLLRPVFDGLAGSMASVLSSRLRQFVRVRVADEWTQLAWEEYVATLPDPSVIATSTCSPTEWRFALHLPIALALLLIDYSLGGDGKNEPTREDVTEIERGLLAPLLTDVWRGSVLPALSTELELSLASSVTTNTPILLQFGRSGEICLVADLYLTLESGEEQCASLIVPISALLSSIESLERAQSNAHNESATNWHDAAASLAGVQLDLKVCYPSIALTSSEIVELREGDVIALAPHGDADYHYLDLVVGDAIFATGALIDDGRNLAVTVLTTEERSL